MATTVGWQGELYVVADDGKIYALPCGDLCSGTCLDQADELPTYEVRTSW